MNEYKLQALNKDTWPTKRWPNFSFDEIKCKETNNCLIVPHVMDNLQRLRKILLKPLIITSGYRAPTHSAERKKEKPGVHTEGLAFDISIYGSDAWRLVLLAQSLDFWGVGLRQHGPIEKRFVHLDKAINKPDRPRPWVWTYDL